MRRWRWGDLKATTLDLSHRDDAGHWQASSPNSSCTRFIMHALLIELVMDWVWTNLVPASVWN